jgi:hypothetical protein
MKHETHKSLYRDVWLCSCGAEWGGTRKTCPSVRHRNNRRRVLARQQKSSSV